MHTKIATDELLYFMDISPSERTERNTTKRNQIKTEFNRSLIWN